jgi:transposase InsO family protein
MGQRAHPRRALQARHPRQRAGRNLAADLFVVQTLTMRTLYAFFFITHARRELVQCSITASPTAAWIWQQFINATPWGRQPGYLIHDRDVVYGKVMPGRLAAVGVTSVRTPVRTPRANGIAERVIRTIRQECLDHVIVLSEHHLSTLLKDFMTYCNEDDRIAPSNSTPRSGSTDL